MDRGRRGFTLVELMVVVAILGILAAVAAPTYLDYLRISKENALRSNFAAAVGLVRNEISKRNAGTLSYLSSPDDFAATLNHGGKKSVYDPGAEAFATSGATPGTVVISQPNPDTYQVTAYNGLGAAITGHDVAIVLE